MKSFRCPTERHTLNNAYENLLIRGHCVNDLLSIADLVAIMWGEITKTISRRTRIAKSYEVAVLKVFLFFYKRLGGGD